MKNFAEIDRAAYTLAREYLPSLGIPGVTTELIEKYLSYPPSKARPATLEEIYQSMLGAAQNASMKAGVIGRAMDGVDKLGPVLVGFSPRAVLVKYGDDWEAILDAIVAEVKPRGQIRRTARSIWPNFCRTIISAARFLEQFASAADFFRWVDFFDQDPRARASLPMLLAMEIDGFGFALACDFLMGLGYTNFTKPDVHLREIFIALGLCPEKPGDYRVFKAVTRLADHAEVSPFNADKVFWLIGSGYFYDDPKIGKEGRVGRQKDKFIAYARPKLGNL